VEAAIPAHDLDRLISGFAERVPGVVRAQVASSDGVPVAASGQAHPGQDRLAAITSGLIGLATAAVRVADGGAFTQAVVAMEQGTLVIMAIDDGSSLAVLATAAADLDEVAYEMTILTEQAGRIRVSARGSGPEPGQPNALAG
jgi:predicted regulator of Ras-like GTPase activity (Roadblock/LC7/MglB family)